MRKKTRLKTTEKRWFTRRVDYAWYYTSDGFYSTEIISQRKPMSIILRDKYGQQISIDFRNIRAGLYTFSPALFGLE